MKTASSPGRECSTQGSCEHLCGLRHVALPILVAIVSFSAFNAAWNHPGLHLYDRFEGQPALQILTRPAIPTYLIGGSGMALLWLWGALRRGSLSAHAVGLGLDGWRPWRRVGGLLLIGGLGLGGFATLQPPSTGEAAPAQAAAAQDAAPPQEFRKPSWGDYCYWFVHLLSASLAELLVFASLTFCLLEAWLRRRGWGKFSSWLVAAAVASVAFGLYHYTHEPRWYRFVYLPLMPVMMINLAYFGWSRNFYLTLLLHNAFAAVGFTQEQFHGGYPYPDAVNPAYYQRPVEMIPVLAAFLIPVLMLHFLEQWQLRQERAPKPSPAPASLA